MKTKMPQTRVKKKLSLVIPVFNSKFLPKILQNSILKLNFPKKDLEVIIVWILKAPENYSLEKIRTVNVKSEERIGYGQAANIGINSSTGQYILLLNPDTKLDPEILSGLIRDLESDERIGVVGPMIYSLKNPRQISTFDIPGMNFSSQFGLVKKVRITDLAKIKSKTEVSWISGSVMFFRKKIWTQIKGFDERFFLYWEDADFCLRVRKLGLKIVIDPKLEAWHLGSASIESQEKQYYLARNSRLFIVRHSSLVGKIWLHLITLAFVFKKMLINKQSVSNLFLKGIFDYYLGRVGEKL